MSEPIERSYTEYKRHSRRSLLTGVAAMAIGYGGWRWLQGRPDADRIPDVLRAGHEANEALWRGLYRDGHLAPTFDRSQSSELRVNGRHGLDDPVAADWEIRVENQAGEQIGRHSLDDIKALPKVEMTVEHKCVEGWSHIVTWGGTPLSGLLAMYDAADTDADYVGLETPDGRYFVGIERDSAWHPQTMLTYELQGEPLSEAHGAPVRLTTPLKYGIKQIKRIGTIRLTNEQPDDYWARRGYDYYAHL